jgi:hypothetical protein
MFTAISGAQLNDAMDASRSRRKVLILDCCYSGAFPAGRTAKADEGVQTLERFQGKGRAVLTASDATQYAFEGNDLRGSGTSSLFTKYLVEAISSGAADLDEDGDIALDELYSYVYEQVVAEVPQQRPKKQEDVDGRIFIARNVHWTLPAYLRHAVESPISAQRLSAMPELEHLRQVGNDIVRAAVAEQLTVLAADDSRSVSAAATALLERTGDDQAGDDQAGDDQVASPDREEPIAAVPAPRPESGQPAEAQAAGAPPPAASRVPEPSPPGDDAPPARTTVPDGRREPEAAAVVDFPATPVLGLLVAAGALLVVSRVLPFDAQNNEYADDLGYATVPWVLLVVLPLVAATQLVLLRGASARRVELAVGLIGGVALIQVAQVLGTAAFAADPDTTAAGGGPGWWLALLGTALLVGCLGVVGRRATFHAGPGVGGTWRSLLGIVFVVVGLLAWLAAFGDFYLWWPANIPGLLMTASALPLAVFALNGAQRPIALVGVTVFGASIAVSILYALLVDSYWSDAARGLVAVGSVLCSLAGCYIAQARSPRRSPHQSAATIQRPR